MGIIMKFFLAAGAVTAYGGFATYTTNNLEFGLLSKEHFQHAQKMYSQKLNDKLKAEVRASLASVSCDIGWTTYDTELASCNEDNCALQSNCKSYSSGGHSAFQGNGCSWNFGSSNTLGHSPSGS